MLYENGLVGDDDARSRAAGGRRTARSSTACARYDKRHGWRQADAQRRSPRGHTIDGFKDERWTRPIAVGDVVPAVVVTAPKTGAGAPAHRRAITPTSSKAGYAWTRRTSAADLFKPGDLVEVAVTKLDEATGTATVTLEQTPLVEGALVAIDNRTGQIKAMVGGWSFSRSKFNRAVQAYRQLGSTFKPIVYTAAIDRGFTPTSILIDAPVSYPAGNGQIYSPHNYDHKFEGPITLRWALEESRNIPAIKMMDTLGPKNVLDYAKRFGFEEDFPPYLPIALGAGDATLLEVTSAYTAFPNQGVRMKPFDVLNVKDRDGNLLEENRAEPSDVIRADTAFVMTNLLRGVLRPRHRRSARRQHGQRSGRSPARPARSTTTPTRGSSASIPTSPSASGSGYDEKKSLGSARAGRARGAADLDGVHEGLHRRPAGQGRSAAVRGARQHRVPRGRQGQRRGAAVRHARRDQRSVHRRHAARRERVQPHSLKTRPRTKTRRARRRRSWSLRVFVSSWLVRSTACACPP